MLIKIKSNFCYGTPFGNKKAMIADQHQVQIILFYFFLLFNDQEINKFQK